MPSFTQTLSAAAFLLAIGASPALADSPLTEGAVVSVNTLGEADYPALTRGRVLLINAQRFVVTREPLPNAKTNEVPPEPPSTKASRPRAPSRAAIWVAGHWIYGPTGFSWVSGRYVAPRAGHVFVPPRWASLDGEYFYFSGFFVPYGVYVRSHFNRYYYSGMPNRHSGPDQGPYWPIGAPTRANSALTSANARDPYWPIGVRR